MASFPDSVPAFGTLTNGALSDAAQVNDLRREVEAIAGGYLEGTARLNSSNSTLVTLSVTGNSTLAAVTAGASTLTSLSVTGNSTLAGTVTFSGGKLAFPATQSGSADANTLDDYEEGTWTPVLTFATAGDQSIVYAAQTGRYTKIGRQVTIHVLLATSTFTHGTASGSLTITGTPFTADSAVEHLGTLSWAGITKANYTDIKPRLNGATTTIDFIASGSAQARSVIAAADVPTGGDVVLHLALTFYVS